MRLYFIKKPAEDGRFAILDRTFQGQKHGCKDFIHFQLRPITLGFLMC